jgi:DNA-binding response OmpR family regulator
MAKIVIIDDDPVMLDLICALVASVGHHAIGEDNGKDGLATIKRVAPDLVFLDCGLRDTSELAILDYVQRNAELSHIPVCILSGRRGSFHERVMAAYGARAVLFKPIELDSLTTAIDRYLSNRPEGRPLSHRVEVGHDIAGACVPPLSPET